jgi:hypothetical protein
MKSALLLLSFLVFLFTSCSSEYFEILKTQQNQNIPSYLQNDQIEDLQKEIDFHAKVSGNAELFKSQLEQN